MSPRLAELKRVLVIGSGPIVIGQAAEFDYSGTQACQALKEEGLEVILINSNPATIMTDAEIADRVYLEPLTEEFVTRIIEREQPDGLLPTIGGQVGLNLARELAESGVLKKHGVELLGTPLSAIQQAEDRAAFKKLMLKIGEPIPASTTASTPGKALNFAKKVGYPVIVRPAYTLGGSGGGIAGDADDLLEIVTRGLKLSPVRQCLIEQSVAGWKEIEYEVLRDGAGTTITICNMENIDPVGVHTGDSVVVAPSQTLTDREYHMLRSASIKIIDSLGIEGGCNIQYALHPASREYAVIEVNPRVSRSSALASKATGYPIAKVSAKVAAGLRLDEIRNPVTGSTVAAFEPSLDYCVIKLPRLPFDKFASPTRRLGTQMQATGEVMAIDRTFTGALLKAIRSLEGGADQLMHIGIKKLSRTGLETKLRVPNDERLFAIAEALRRRWSVHRICELSSIDKFFVEGIAAAVVMERELIAAKGGRASSLSADVLRRAKRLGFSDAYIGALTGQAELAIRRRRKLVGVTPVYKMVDTCAAEFEASTPYYYSTYDGENEAQPPEGRKAIVLGSGPIRIGQGIEFDYSAVHAAWALREEDIQSVVINNNPETVSTDFNTSDRLYFEPLTLEDVLNVIEREAGGGWQPDTGRPDIEGVVAQFGGQTAINLAGPLAKLGVPVLGTAVEEMDRAEDREKFDVLLRKLEIPKPPGATATTLKGALKIAGQVGYPVLVRPSYVLGGRAMEIVYSEAELKGYMASAVKVSRERPVLVDKYLLGLEVEVDAVADGSEVLIAGIMEHIERAGVHSGDSIAVYPPQHISRQIQERVIEYTKRLALALKIRGMVNIQFIVQNGDVFVIEVNPRSSRTVPFLAKAAGLPLARLAARVMAGASLAQLGYPAGLWPEPQRVAVKAPVFSWQKLLAVDITLSPEMKSTGEVMGSDVDFPRALYKALLAAGLKVPQRGSVLFTIADQDKPESLALAAEFHRLGFRILATGGTLTALQACKIPAVKVNKVSEGKPTIPDLIRTGKIDLVVNTFTVGRLVDRDGFLIRRAAVEHNVPCLTSLDTTQAMLQVLATQAGAEHAAADISALQDWPRSPIAPRLPIDSAHPAER